MVRQRIDPILSFGVALSDRCQKSNAPYAINLLPARRERPCRCRAAEECNELAPPHELPSDEAHNLAHHLDHRRACASQRNLPAYVGSGSNPNLPHRNTDARFTSISRPQQDGFIATLWATSGRTAVQQTYSLFDHLVGQCE
jgi:hypothetical protein